MVTAVHPMPPISPVYAKIRDASLRMEMQRLARQNTSGILMGDFNDTPWSAGIRSLEPTLSRASGMQPTWPNVYGLLSLLPLDHILVTRHWRVQAYALGPNVGSDHRPVIATLVSAPQISTAPRASMGYPQFPGQYV